MTKTVKKSAGNKVRSISEDTWTTTEYGARLFSMGGNLYGPKSQMFKLAVGAACIDVLAQDVSKTPFELRRYVTNGSVVVQPKEHRAAALLKRGPNDYMGPVEFLRTVVSQLSVYSEYFIAARRRNNMELAEFVGIPRGNITDIAVNVEARKWYYDINPQTQHEMALFGWAQGRQTHRDVAHIKRRSLNGFDVLSTSSLSAGAFDLLGKMQSHQAGSYSNGGIPQVAFTFPDGLTDEQFERLKIGLAKSMKKAQGDGTPIILEGSDGVVPQVEKLSVTATDSEFIKANVAAAMDVIRYFRVPPHKVYLMESIKYDNMDSAERVYVDDTLCSYFADIEEALNKVLLTNEERDEYFFKFDVESAYALNPTEKQKIIESRWTKGMIEQDEMRRAIGMNTYGGDVGRARTFSSNQIVVDKDNNVLISAGGNKPGDDEKEIEIEETEKPKKGAVVQLVG